MLSRAVRVPILAVFACIAFAVTARTQARLLLPRMLFRKEPSF